jgi:retron-type reverse transcriptase
MVRAGYVEYGKRKSSIIGVPQGSIVSPILSNLILNELDRYVEKLITENDLKLGNLKHTLKNPEYYKIDDRIQTIGKTEKRRKAQGKVLDEDRKLERKKLIKVRSRLNSTIPNPGYAKFYYVRYADD